MFICVVSKCINAQKRLYQLSLCIGPHFKKKRKKENTSKWCHVAVNKETKSVSSIFCTLSLAGLNQLTCKQASPAVWEHQRLNSATVPLLIVWAIFTVAIAVLMQSEGLSNRRWSLQYMDIYTTTYDDNKALFFYSFSSNYNDDSFSYQLMSKGGHMANHSSRRLQLK